jgi:integrase
MARVRTAKPKAGRAALMVGDGGGLWLQCTRGAGDHVRRSWTFRYQLNGERHEIGLGPTYTLGLAEAREKARTLRQQLLEGVDPLEAREASRRARLAEKAKAVTFERCAVLYFELHRDGWRSARHAGEWLTSLKRFAFPVIGGMSVADIDQAAILKALDPIWKTKTETAARVRGRIEKVLDYATANNFRHGDNPARHLLNALPKKTKLTKKRHFAALPWEEIPVFLAELRAGPSATALCLEFLVLTAARSGEALGARWDEIDLKGKARTIPGARMKSGREHRVPLSDRAIAILNAVPRRGAFVFGGTKPLAHNATRELLKRRRSGATPHGMRAAFRTWVSEATNYPDHIAEAALAHAVGTGVERAYKRGDLFERRRKLMHAWAAFCSQPRAVGTTVTPLRKAGAHA